MSHLARLRRLCRSGPGSPISWRLPSSCCLWQCVSASPCGKQKASADGLWQPYKPPGGGFAIQVRKQPFDAVYRAGASFALFSACQVSQVIRLFISVDQRAFISFISWLYLPGPVAVVQPPPSSAHVGPSLNRARHMSGVSLATEIWCSVVCFAEGWRFGGLKGTRNATLERVSAVEGVAKLPL